jgi:hypothetical protein
MKTPSNVSCVVVAAVLAAACVGAAEPAQLTTLREQRDKAVEQVRQKAQAEEKRLNEQYLRSIDSLMQTLTRAGNLDAALAVRDERNRVAEALGTTNKAVVGQGAGAPDVPRSVEVEKKNVTLTKPYSSSYSGAPTDRLSLQYAVIELGKQVGLQYDWNESYKNTDPLCRRWVYPEIKNKSFQSAMKELLHPLGLTYELRDGTTIVLKKK